MVQIRSVGGAVNDVPADATAYAHRHQQLLLTPVSAAGPNPGFEAAWEPVHAHTDGMYLSFERDRGSAPVAEAFPPTTLARLRAIKRRVDPDQVFTQNFDLSPPHAPLATVVPHPTGEPEHSPDDSLPKDRYRDGVGARGR